MCDTHSHNADQIGLEKGIMHISRPIRLVEYVHNNNKEKGKEKCI